MLHSVNIFMSYLVNNPIKRFAFALVTGILLAGSLAFFGGGFWAWFGLIPLLLLIKSADSLVSAMIESFVFLFGYNAISFSWLIGLHPLTWQGLSEIESVIVSSLAIIVPAAFHALVLMIFVLVTKLIYKFKTDDRSHELSCLDALILAFVWVAIEYKLIFNLGKDLGAFFVPINFLAYSQYENKPLIQACNIYGALGLEFLIVFCNTYLSNFFNIQNASKNSLWGRKSEFNIKQPFYGVQKTNIHAKILGGFLIIMSAIYGYGLVTIFSHDHLRKDLHKDLKTFAIVQADYSAAASRSSNPRPDNLIQLQLELSSKINNPLDLMVWSEGSIPVVEKQALINNQFKDFANTVNLFAFGSFDQDQDGNYYNSINYLDYIFTKDYSDYKSFSKTLLSDEDITKIQEDLDSDSPEENLAEPEEVADESRIKYLENIAIHKYFKKILVPFGEYTPFMGLLPSSLKKLAESTIGTGFEQSKLPLKPTKTQDLKIANSVCFELLFPKLISSQVYQGAEVILNLNDLSWFNNFLKGEMIKKQFLAVAVFRAVENKRDLILAGNTGYSALIDSTGRIRYRTNHGKIAILLGRFLPLQDQSAYSLYGW